jgi:hypothetical protein
MAIEPLDDEPEPPPPPAPLELELELLDVPELVVVPGSGSLHPMATPKSVAMDASTKVWIFISHSSHVRASPHRNRISTAIDERLVDFHDDREHIHFFEEVFGCTGAHVGALQLADEDGRSRRIEGWTTSAIEREACGGAFDCRNCVIEARQVEVERIRAQTRVNLHLDRVARDSIRGARIPLDEIDDVATRRAEHTVDGLRRIERTNNVRLRARFAVSRAAFEVENILHGIGKLRCSRGERRNVKDHREFVPIRPRIHVRDVRRRVHLDCRPIQVIRCNGPRRTRDDRERGCALKISHFLHGFSFRNDATQSHDVTFKRAYLIAIRARKIDLFLFL